MSMNVTVIGAGLAGSECAWQLAQRGIQVELHEMKPEKMTPAHTTEYFAELCCSNSLRGAGLENAVGLLKEELRRLDSLILQCADATRVEAGGALAVDRHGFARLVTEKVRSHPNITVIPGEVTEIPEGEVIIASGPLTSDALAETLQGLLGEHSDLHFFDAAAPLVSAESVDMEHAWMGSRYDKGTDDYVNCPMNQEEYDAFWKELTTAQEAEVHGFEDSMVFEGCMPVEVMARRGHDTLLYGPLKSRGLDDPRTGRWPYAVVQLRRDNAEGSVYNLVGFQTHLKFPEQRRVFSMIPALRNAEFLRYGVMHRNTFLDSPRLLDRYYRLKKEPRIAFAGQMTGVEGYVESAASGFLVGVETARRLKGQPPVDFPREMAVGALALYISNESVTQFQPMNINFGIMPLTVFQTPYVSDYLKMGPETLSYIKILMSVGMMTGAALLPKLGKIKTPVIAVAAGVIMGAALIEMSIAQSLSSPVLKMGILTLSMLSIGFGGGLLNVIIGSSVMKAVPKEMMGRISGFLTAMMQASMPVASFICSALAVYFHIPHILVFFGSMTLICSLALYFRKKLDALS